MNEPTGEQKLAVGVVLFFVSLAGLAMLLLNGCQRGVQ
jgi:hypothetical protein